MEEEKTLELNEVIATEKKIGRPRKENKCVVVPISIPMELKMRIDNERKEKSRSAFICDIINMFFNSENVTNYMND